MQAVTSPSPCPRGHSYTVTASGGTPPYVFQVAPSPPNPQHILRVPCLRRSSGMRFIMLKASRCCTRIRVLVGPLPRVQGFAGYFCCLLSVFVLGLAGCSRTPANDSPADRYKSDACENYRILYSQVWQSLIEPNYTRDQDVPKDLLAAIRSACKTWAEASTRVLVIRENKFELQAAELDPLEKGVTILDHAPIARLVVYRGTVSPRSSGYSLRVEEVVGGTLEPVFDIDATRVGDQIVLAPWRFDVIHGESVLHR